MPKLNKKSGMSLVEIMCAIGVMSILSISILTFQLNNLRLNNYNKDKLMYVTALEAIKEEMISNATYYDLLSLRSQNKIYVNKDKLTINSIKSLNLEHIFSESCNNLNTYILLNITTGEVLNIELELHLKLKSTEEVIKCVFYKGNYL
jgi:prepilin-type N-terminal cleavage/methylation domain-containing protein